MRSDNSAAYRPRLLTAVQVKIVVRKETRRWADEETKQGLCALGGGSWKSEETACQPLLINLRTM